MQGGSSVHDGIGAMDETPTKYGLRPLHRCTVRRGPITTSVSEIGYDVQQFGSNTSQPAYRPSLDSLGCEKPT